MIDRRMAVKMISRNIRSQIGIKEVSKALARFVELAPLAFDRKLEFSRDPAKVRTPYFHRPFGVLSAFTILISCAAMADSPRDIANSWNLIGRWAENCTGPDNTFIEYKIEPDGRLVFSSAAGLVTTTSVSTAEGNLILHAVLPRSNETRVIAIQRVGSRLKTVMNRNEKNEYTIQDGMFLHDNKAAPLLEKCSGDIAEYNRQLVAHITRFKRFPPTMDSSKTEIRLVVKFSVDSNGSLVQSHVSESSNDAAVDAEGLATLERAAPYPRPPTSEKLPLDFTLPFIYRRLVTQEGGQK